MMGDFLRTLRGLLLTTIAAAAMIGVMLLVYRGLVLLGLSWWIALLIGSLVFLVAYAAGLTLYDRRRTLSRQVKNG